MAGEPRHRVDNRLMMVDTDGDDDLHSDGTEPVRARGVVDKTALLEP